MICVVCVQLCDLFSIQHKRELAHSWNERFQLILKEPDSAVKFSRIADLAEGNEVFFFFLSLSSMSVLFTNDTAFVFSAEQYGAMSFLCFSSYRLIVCTQPDFLFMRLISLCIRKPSNLVTLAQRQKDQDLLLTIFVY
jgi:hypothetical protein